MKVLLISSNTEVLNMPTMPLGLAQVAASTQAAGHAVRFLDLMHEPDPLAAVARAVAEQGPDVIGVSVRNIDDQERQAPRLLVEQVRPVIAACRSATAAPVVLGGTGFSIFPDEVLDLLGADCGVRGDGEEVFPLLLARLAAGEDPHGLPGVYVAGREGAAPPDFPATLDAWPLPDTDVWAYLDPGLPELWVPVQSRRGCPNDCFYCSTCLIQGRAIRTRSPQSVIESMARLARAGFERFYIVDNSFNIPEAHALELCRRMEEARLGVTWRCILYPHRVSARLVEAMRRAGCVQVALGFESGSLPILRRMNKRFTPDDVRATSELLAAHGIARMGFLLLGGPGETRETVEESLAFAESLGLEMLRTTIGVRIYPHTPLARIAVDEGLLDPAESLLTPRFYLAPGLDPWIYGHVAAGVRVERPPSSE